MSNREQLTIKRKFFSNVIWQLRYVLLCLVINSSAFAGNVYIITSSNSESNQKAAQLINERLGLQTPDIQTRIINVEQLYNQTFDENDLLVTVGDSAAKSIQLPTLLNPKLFSFTNQASLPFSAGNWAAVVTDQPLKRLLAVVPPIIENSFKKQVLLPVSPDNEIITNHALNSNDNNLTVVKIPETEKPAKKIDSHLFKSGALIAVKDKHIWSGENARWMLYQAYRNNVPVIGYSKKFLKAGALVAVYSTVEQIAENTAQQILQWHQHQKLTTKGVIFSNYNVEYNTKIARTLRISIPENRFNLESDK